MSPTATRILGLLAVAFGAAALGHGSGWSTAGALRAGQGLLGAVAWGGAAVGIGGALLGRARLAEAFCLGWVTLGTVALPLFGVAGVSPEVCAVLLVLGWAGWIRRPTIDWNPPPAVVVLGICGVLALGLLDALAPPVDTDEIYQHLALPQQMLLHGDLLGGWLHPDGSRPLPLHLVWTGALALGGEAAPKLLHLGLVALLLCSVWELGVKHLGKAAAGLALLVLVGSYTFLRELGLAYNNLPAALACLLAMGAVREDKPLRVGLFSGAALAFKYTAGPVVAGVFLAWVVARRRLDRPVVMAGVLALAWLAPWWIRNVAGGLHPLFPYMGWPTDLGFMASEKYGMGRAPLDFFLLPWNLTVHAETDSFRFLGRVNPVGLACLPAALWVGVRSRSPWGIASAVLFAGWSAGPQWLRHLLPGAPILALALGEGFAVLPGWGRMALVGAWVLGLPGNLGPWLGSLQERAGASFHPERQEAVLRGVDGYRAAAWVAQEAPADARVAMLFSSAGYYVGRPAWLGSVEDHIPTRHWLRIHGEESLHQLSALGVTHLLVSHVGFIHKAYPHLSKEEFALTYTAPEALLSDLLLSDAVLVFQDGRHSVWRLEP